MAGVYLKHLIFFVQNYGSSGAPDQRAVQTFMDCETAESIKMLQNELRAVTLGKADPKSLDLVVGVKRRQLHRSFEEWAKLMLLWMSSYKN